MIGFVAGSLAMARYGNRLREGQWIAISFIGMAIGSIIYSQLHSVTLAIVIGSLNATLNAPSVVGRQLIIQRQTPREMRVLMSLSTIVVAVNAQLLRRVQL